METRILGLIFFISLFTLAISGANAQTAGDYRSSVATGNWSAAGSWETFDGSTWNPAGSAPAGTSGTITIQTGHTITVNAAITINGSAVVVDGYLKDIGTITRTSGTFTFNNGSTYELAHAPASGTGIPTSTWNTGSTCLLTGITSATTGINASQTFYNLTVNCPSWAGSLNLGWNTGTTTINGNVTVKNTGTGRWQFCAPAAGNSATVNINGNLIVDGSTSSASSMVGVTSNGTSNGNTTIVINIGGNVTVTGNAANKAWTNFSVSRGSQSGTGTSTWNISGSFTMTDATTQNSNATGAKYVFVGATTHLMTLAGDSLVSLPVEVASGSTLNMGTSILRGSGLFTLNSGATLETAHDAGIDSTLKNTGTKTLNAGANYIYDGAASQVTGTTFPATINNLTINNASINNTVTLTGSVTANGTLAVNSGDLLLNGNTVTLGPSGSLAETPGNTVGGDPGLITTTRTLTAPAGANIAGMGAAITSGADLGSTVITRGHALQTNGTNYSIYRYFDITPTTNTGLNATLVFKYDESELNFIAEANLILFSSTDAGGTWTGAGGTPDPGNNVVTVSGLNSFSRWTAADVNAPLPVQLASFTATPTTQNSVRLDWVTISEINNYGFEAQRSTQRTNGFQSISTLIPGNGTTNERHFYSYTDNTASVGQWFYRLKQIDLDGTVHFTEPVQVDVLTAFIETAPLQFTLAQNYPNPFNPSTNIRFSVEKTAKATLEVFNMLGQKVLTLFDETAEAGKFYTVKLNAEHLSSGMYLYRLESSNKSEMKKLLLLK